MAPPARPLQLVMASTQPIPSSDAGHPLDHLPGYRCLRPLRSRGAPREVLAVREGNAGFRRLCSLRFASAQDAAGDDLAREAAVVARLRHPSILPAFDLIESKGWRVLVLAFEGVFSVDRIAAAMRKRPVRLDTQAALFVAHGVFDALAHAHGKSDAEGAPLVHGDIHPANIVVRRDGHVIVRGFRGSLPPRASSTDEPGPYAAPELLRGRPASPGSDVFGAAAVVWELFAGRALQPRPDGHVPSLAVERPDLPAELAAVFDVCLSDDPDARRIRASTMAATLRKAVDLQGGRESLERLYVRVLKRLPASVRALCAGTLPPRVPEVSSSPTDRFVRSERVPSEPLIVGHPSHPLHNAAGPRHAPRITVGDALALEVATHPESGPRTAADPFDEETPTARRLASGALADDDDENDDEEEDEDDGIDTMVRERPEVGEGAFGRIGREPGALEPRSFPPVSTDPEDAVGAARQPENFGRRFAVAIGVALLLAPAAWAAGQYGAGPVYTALTGNTTHAAHEGSAVAAVAAASTPASEPAAESAADVVASAPPAREAASRPAVASAPAVSASIRPAASSSPTPTIGFHQSMLLVEGPPEGVVYVNGVAVGKTGERSLTRGCGLRFVRVGTEARGPTLHGVRWLSKGQTAKLVCGEFVSLRAKPRR